ncbi:MAG: Fic family protein [Cytophagales bacterium]|nr:Fic family protein [Cytophagales bacterium]
MAKHIHQMPKWPAFQWHQNSLAKALSAVRHKQGKLIGKMEALGFNLRSEANLTTLTLDVITSSEIEGEVLNPDQVRSSVARRLGMDIAGLKSTDRHIEGIVEMMMDATQKFDTALTSERLFGWHAAMFPGGRSGMRKITTGAWRDNTQDDPMQVVTGPMGKERVHFQAPDADQLKPMMKAFLKWFNQEIAIDPVLKAGIAHVWFVTIHPFDDGNGRIARAIADMQLARSDESPQRFYSMSSQIRLERNEYYAILEQTQKGTLDITSWLTWFLKCLDRALIATESTLAGVIQKARFWEVHASTPMTTRQQRMVQKLLDNFEGNLTTSKWAKMAKCSHDTALRDIQDLIEKGVLVKGSGGSRSTVYMLKV